MLSGWPQCQVGIVPEKSAIAYLFKSRQSSDAIDGLPATFVALEGWCL